MELIDRYIHEVSRRLPRRLREDVAAELRSSLMESYESMLAGAGEDADREALAVDLLRKFGPPGTLAASYRPGPQWLIGPDLYPAFLRTVKIVAAVIIALLGVAVVAASLDEADPFLHVARALFTGDVLSTLVSALGWVVVVFWIIERTTDRRQGTAAAMAGGGAEVFPAALRADAASAWDPRELPEVNDPDRIDSRTGLMVEIAIMAGLILLFGVFHRSIGASVSVNGDRGWIALLGPGFLEHRALLYVGFIGVALMNIALLRRNRWTIPTRIADLVFNLVFIVALVSMIRSGEIVAVQPADLIANGWTPEAAHDLSRGAFPLLDTLARTVFAGIVVFIVAHTVHRAVKLVRRLQ